MQPTEVWHYTRSRDALEISGSCLFFKSSLGTDGPGVYFTNIRPRPERERISFALWDGWKPANMTAYVRVPFNAADMLESKVPNVWYRARQRLLPHGPGRPRRGLLDRYGLDGSR